MHRRDRTNARKTESKRREGQRGPGKANLTVNCMQQVSSRNEKTRPRATLTMTGPGITTPVSLLSFSRTRSLIPMPSPRMLSSKTDQCQSKSLQGKKSQKSNGYTGVHKHRWDLPLRSVVLAQQGRKRHEIERSTRQVRITSARREGKNEKRVSSGRQNQYSWPGGLIRGRRDSGKKMSTVVETTSDICLSMRASRSASGASCWQAIR